MEMVANKIGNFAKKQKGFSTTSTSKRSSYYDNSELVWKLKKKPFELVYGSLKAEHSGVHHKHY